jgi:aryl-alcohol dehydrogenase-like predicted oxidoreductase
MKTVRLGRTDISVVNAPLGAMFLGTRQNRDVSFALLDYYVSRGGNFIDSANIYAHWVGPQFHGGESETVLGEWMRARRNRNSLVVATKVGFGYSDVPQSLTARRIMEECDKSLKRLGIETIDLYFAHVDDLAVPPEESLGAFAELVRAGKVRSIGASNFTTGRLATANACAAANGLPRYEVLQPRHTYLRPRHDATFGAQLVLTSDMADYCRSAQISVMPYSSGLGGAYQARADRPLPAQYQSADSDARLAALRDIAAETKSTPHQLVFAWLAAKGTLPLVAGSTTEQLSESLDGIDVPLTSEQVGRLDAAGE